MRDESAAWTVGARRGPRTGRGQPGAARGGHQEAARARPGLRGQIPAQPESRLAGLTKNGTQAVCVGRIGDKRYVGALMRETYLIYWADR